MRLKQKTVEPNIVKVTDVKSGRVSYQVRVRRKNNDRSVTEDTLQKARNMRNKMLGKAPQNGITRTTVSPNIQKSVNHNTGKVSYVVRYKGHYVATLSKLDDAKFVRDYAVVLHEPHKLKDEVLDAVDNVETLTLD